MRNLRYIVSLGWHFFLRDFYLQYRRSFIGALWSLVPLVSLLSAVVLLGSELQESTPSPYPLYVCSGLVLLQAFTDGLKLPQRMARRAKSLLARNRHLRYAVLFAALFRSIFNVMVRLVALVAIIAYFGHAAFPQAYLFIVGLLSAVLAGLSLGIMITPLSLVYFDIRYSLGMVEAIFLISTPFFYPIPEAGIIRGINLANPLTYLTLASQEWLMIGSSRFSAGFIVTSLSLLPLLWVAVAYYRRAMPRGIIPR